MRTHAMLTMAASLLWASFLAGEAAAEPNDDVDVAADKPASSPLILPRRIAIDRNGDDLFEQVAGEQVIFPNHMGIAGPFFRNIREPDAKPRYSVVLRSGLIRPLHEDQPRHVLAGRFQIIDTETVERGFFRYFGAWYAVTQEGTCITLELDGEAIRDGRVVLSVSLAEHSHVSFGDGVTIFCRRANTESVCLQVLGSGGNAGPRLDHCEDYPRGVPVVRGDYAFEFVSYHQRGQARYADIAVTWANEANPAQPPPAK